MISVIDQYETFLKLYIPRQACVRYVCLMLFFELRLAYIGVLFCLQMRLFLFSIKIERFAHLVLKPVNLVKAYAYLLNFCVVNCIQGASFFFFF